MITEYIDCAEFKRLIEDKKLKPATLKYFLKKRGIVFTASNAQQFAEQIYTIFLGAKEIEDIRDMITNDGNYEKSLVMNVVFNEIHEEDILDILIDEFCNFKTTKSEHYNMENPVRNDNGAYIQFSYVRKLPGRNKLLQQEKRYLKMNIRKISEKEAVIDIRQQSSIDSANAVDFLEKAIGQDIGVKIKHINLNLLSSANRVEFFDRIAAYKFKLWSLKTITGITVKQGVIEDDDEEDAGVILDETEESENPSTLTGISQAVLNGSGLRSNEFVQNSIERGYYISAMKYRYEHKMENTEFAVVISLKKKDLRVDIDKTYLDDEGRIFVQPLIKKEQDEIIVAFQEIAYKEFDNLLSEQIRSSNND